MRGDTCAAALALLLQLRGEAGGGLARAVARLQQLLHKPAQLCTTLLHPVDLLHRRLLADLRLQVLHPGLLRLALRRPLIARALQLLLCGGLALRRGRLDGRLQLLVALLTLRTPGTLDLELLRQRGTSLSRLLCFGAHAVTVTAELRRRHWQRWRMLGVDHWSGALAAKQLPDLLVPALHHREQVLKPRPERQRVDDSGDCLAGLRRSGLRRSGLCHARLEAGLEVGLARAHRVRLPICQPPNRLAARPVHLEACRLRRALEALLLLLGRQRQRWCRKDRGLLAGLQRGQSLRSSPELVGEGLDVSVPPSEARVLFDPRCARAGRWQWRQRLLRRRRRRLSWRRQRRRQREEVRVASLPPP
mmetsp:Transcript_63632/g.163784  ORF Transcript_63632/g.163784 Transcript_63632/m.163784 type:complete len:362 (-) Transcript_63632:234-1319(-)